MEITDKDKFWMNNKLFRFFRFFCFGPENSQGRRIQ